MFVKFHVCHSVLSLFLIWITLNIKVPLRKWKGLAGDNCKGTVNIEFEQDWSVGLGATLGVDRKLKNIFLVRRIFPGKADCAIILGLECTINPQNLMKIVGAIFEKMKILQFSLCELPLILGGRSKTKKWAKYICRGTLDIECKWEWAVVLGATLGDGQKNKTIFFGFRDFSGERQ